MTSSLLIHESPLQVLPTLAVQVGLNEAIILQQIHYWLNPKFNKNEYEGRLWVYNTYEQWQEQFPFWSQKTIQRAITSLEKTGVLLSYVAKEFNKTKHYSIDYDCLNSLSFQQDKSNDSTCPLPSGQIVLFDQDTNNSPSGQNDLFDQDNMSRSYIDTEITHEITLPPLTPPLEERSMDEEDEEEILRKMIAIWNSHVQTKLRLDPVVYVSESRKTKLHQIFLTLFKQNHSAWQSYCQQIAACQFLMGSNDTGFRVNLDWALHPENACKVLEGFYYDKGSVKTAKGVVEPQIQGINLEDLEQDSVNRPYADFWLQLSKIIINKLGPHTYSSWFKNLQITELTDKVLTLEVETAFAKDYIRNHYHTELLEAVRSIRPYLVRIEYRVPSNKGALHG